MQFASAHTYISKRKVQVEIDSLDKHSFKGLTIVREEKERSDSCSSISDSELDKFNNDFNSDEELKDPPKREKLDMHLPKPVKGAKELKLSTLNLESGAKPKNILAKKEKPTTRAAVPKVKQTLKLPKSNPNPVPKALLRKIATNIVNSVALGAVAGYTGRHYRQEVDTNIVSFNLSVLKDKTTIATGDAIFCSKCKAILNAYSTIKEDIWVCEFCNNPNKVVLEEEEIPKVDHLTYILESAQQLMQKKEGGEDTTLIFCIDISGSMCMTQPVIGKLALKYDKLKELNSLEKFGNGSAQLMSGENANQTYVSRMQCVQTAIESQLKQLITGAPKRKVGIVTFSNEVTLIGDGSLAPKTFAGDKLMNFEGLLETSMKDADLYMTKPIEATHENLIKRLEEIKESGQTALGPGLTVALGAAIKGTPGSQVIICTDGLANIGFGSVENLEDEETAKATRDFYTRIGELAKDRGVSISIVSIVNEECNLEMLSPLADLTGGDIVKVDPMNLSSDFANILSESVIATNVELHMKLHKGLTFRNEDPSQLSEDGSLLIKPIGNVTEGQEVTIEYCVKPAEELKRLTDINLIKVKELPFQAQINYNSLDGAKCVRLITKKQSITFEKEQARKAANYQVISVHAIQKTANIAQKGDYRGAQANSAHWKRVLKGSSEYNNFMLNVGPLYKALDKQQMEDLQVMKVRFSGPPISKNKATTSSKNVPSSLGFNRTRLNDSTVSSLNRAARFNSKRINTIPKK